ATTGHHGNTKQSTSVRPLKKLIRDLYLDNFKPIYLIFDQFEELFIFGNQNEKDEFIRQIKTIAESDLHVKLLFIIREEYLAGITEFEKHIPGILENRIRIEKMRRTNAVQCIEGPCRVAGIDVEDGFSEALLDKLSPGSAEVELTYLQVFLDKIYRTADPQGHLTKGTALRIGKSAEYGDLADRKTVSENPDTVILSEARPEPGRREQAKELKRAGTDDSSFASLKMTFSDNMLSQMGDVRDLLGSFLEEQIAGLDDPDAALAILKSFVSVKGTKRQITQEEINEHCKTIGVNLNYETFKKQIAYFVNIRILRDKDENGRYELRHDALAAKIYEKITLVEKELMEVRQLIENAHDNYTKRNILLSANDLQYIAPYEDKLILNQILDKFLEKSKNEILRVKKRRRNIWIAAACILFCVFAGFTLWAMSERNKAIENEKIAIEKERLANEQKKKAEDLYKELAIKTEEAVKAKDDAISEREKAVKAEKKTLEEKKIAESAKKKAVEERKRAELEQQKTKAMLLMNYSKDFLGSNPTKALRLAEYACLIDSSKTNYNELRNMFNENILNHTLYKHKTNISALDINEEGRYIAISGGDNVVRIFEFDDTVLKRIAQYSHSNKITAVDVSTSVVASGSIDKTISVYDIYGDSLIKNFPVDGIISSLCIDEKGMNIIYGLENGDIKSLDLETDSTIVFKNKTNKPINTLFYSNSFIVASAGNSVFSWKKDGKPAGIDRDFNNEVNTCVYNEDGSFVLLGTKDRYAYILNMAGFEENRIQHEAGVTSVMYFSDIKKLITGTGNGRIYIWNRENKKLLEIITGHSKEISFIRFSPNREYLITGSTDGTMRLLYISEDEILNLNDGFVKKISYEEFIKSGFEYDDLNEDEKQDMNITD
ncbi:MAG: hypothetical protein KJ607_11560, partial [Bacteroidetes bacterium]|nr:hypothetical protein [Bacteroidota bacterium]